MEESSQNKKTKGRQKTCMEKITNPNNLQVTFSKRRAGLFKKASELCTLSGADAAVIVFSPADKVYCFGHPNVQSVVGRFAGESDKTSRDPIIEAHRNSTIRELNSELTHLETMLRMEKKRSDELDIIRNMGRFQRWLPISTEEMNLEELEELEESVKRFQKDFDAKLKLHIANTNDHHNNNNNNNNGDQIQLYPQHEYYYSDIMRDLSSAQFSHFAPEDGLLFGQGDGLQPPLAVDRQRDLTDVISSSSYHDPTAGGFPVDGIDGGQQLHFDHIYGNDGFTLEFGHGHSMF